MTRDDYMDKHWRIPSVPDVPTWLMDGTGHAMAVTYSGPVQNGSRRARRTPASR
jgi:hypothetical protein